MLKLNHIIISINLIILFSAKLASQDSRKLKVNETITVSHEPFDWKMATPESFNIDTDTLNAFFDRINEWENLRSLLIIRDNKLITEKYYHGQNRYSAYNTFSITKSITSALIGIAIKQNFIKSENEKIIAYLPEYADKINDPKKKNITIKHLLTMTAGLKPKEWWNPDIDIALLEAPIGKEPGEEFLYYNALPDILSMIISKSTNLSLKKFAEINLFEPLEMKCAYWNKDGKYYSGRSSTYFTSRDLARLGSLYLNNGNINGKQIIDSSWIEKSFENYAESDINFFLTGHSLNQTGYGYLWWTFEAGDKVYYSAYGAGDQFLLIDPTDNTIIVISQVYKETWFEQKEDIDMISELLSIIKNSK